LIDELDPQARDFSQFPTIDEAGNGFTIPIGRCGAALRLLVLSTPADGRCGVGDYNGHIMRTLTGFGATCDLLALPHVTERGADREKPVDKFLRLARGYDAAILQVEFGLYGKRARYSIRLLTRLIRGLAGKPTLLMMHSTFPEVPKWSIFRPFSSRLLVGPARRAFAAAINHANNVSMFVHGEHSLSRWRRILDHDRVASIVFPVEERTDLVEPRPLIRGEPVELLIFGFVAEYKGYEIALNAMRLLPKNFRLTIAGANQSPKDPAVKGIPQFIETGQWMREPGSNLSPVPSAGAPFTPEERLAFRQRVRITGAVPPADVPATFNAADIVLLPYRWGPAGSAALGYAIAFCRPTIATKLPTFNEIAKHTDCLRLVPPDDPATLARQILELADNLDERRQMFRDAMYFARGFSFSALARKIEATLRNVSTSGE
jgi:glycosyltransferase involved in cell wall biosynthesis